MRRNKILSVLTVCLTACLLTGTARAEKINLAGMWRFQLDPMRFGKTPGSELYLSRLTETIALPGSTDEGGKGIQNVVAHVESDDFQPSATLQPYELDNLFSPDKTTRTNQRSSLAVEQLLNQ